jgi:hypothetical protein
MLEAIDWGSIGAGIVIGFACGWYLRTVFAKR